jgi:hypothetical protein
MPDFATRHVVEILLPLFSNAGKRFGREPFDRTRQELLDRFGGITAFTRSPAEGLWAEEGQTVRDEVVIFEIVADSIDAAWWTNYRRTLEDRFKQESIMIRSHEVVQL